MESFCKSLFLSGNEMDGILTFENWLFKELELKKGSIWFWIVFLKSFVKLLFIYSIFFISGNDCKCLIFWLIG